MATTTSHSQTALITGATGFIGGHLAQRLVRDGWHVHAIVRASSNKSITLDPVIRTYIHDGTTEGMIRIMQDVKPNVVFHLASLFLAQHKPQDVTNLIQSNVTFGTQLIEAMIQCGVRNLINTGTTWQHYQDADYSPVCLYAATKQAFETILQYYVEACGLRVITLQLSDTYGPNDTRPKLLNLLKAIAISGEPLAMSAGEQLLDLVHIEDVTNAFVVASERIQTTEWPEVDVPKAENYCVCTGHPMQLRNVVILWMQITGCSLNIHWGARPYRPREMMQTWIRGQTLPGWQAQISIEQGLKALGEKI